MIQINWGLHRVRAIRFIHLQLLLSLTTVVVLSCWGLPTSLISPLGNMVFGPFMTSFLFVSSLLFFSELLSIPNQWCATVLEWITHAWHYCLSYHPDNALIGFTQPPMWLIIGIVLATIAISYHPRTRTPLRSILLLALLLFGSSLFLKYGNRPTRGIHQLTCNNGEVTVVYDGTHNVVIDPGYIGQRPSAPSWALHTLLPTLNKVTGRPQLEHLIILQPGSWCFEALIELIAQISVTHLHIIDWNGKVPYSTWRHFNDIQKICAQNNIQLHRIGADAQTYILSERTSIHIQPLEKTIAYADSTYQTTAITTVIDNHPFTIYAAKHKKRHSGQR